MKLRTLLLTFLLILGVALGAASLANADFVSTPTTLWAPTSSDDQDVFHFNFSSQTCVRELDLYINAPGATQSFATGASGNALLLQIVPGVPFSGTEFSIEQTGGTNGDWYVYNANNVQLLDLGQTNQFGLFYKDYGTNGLGQSPYVLQPTITPVSGTSAQWVLNDGYDGCASVLIADAAPLAGTGSATPIPGTFLLFGSGLAGALGFLRRFSI